MKFEFLVSVELTRQSGKFETRDDMLELIRTTLEEANPGEFQGPNHDGEYTVDGWDVGEYVPPKKGK